MPSVIIVTFLVYYNYTWHFNSIVNIQYFNLLQHTIHFNPNNFNLTVLPRQYTSVL